jgi:hypothetical protein
MIRVVLDLPKPVSAAQFQKLRTEPLHAYARATTQYVDLKDVLNYAELRGQITYVNAYALSQYINLKAANVEIDPTPVDRWVNDIQVVADQVALVFDKGLSDSLSQFDEIVLANEKVLDDFFFPFDFYKHDTGKVLDDLVDPLSDETSFAVLKGFAELQGLSDAISKGFEAPHSDSFSMSDSSRLGVGKGLEDEAPTIEEIFFDIGFNLSDSQSSSDHAQVDTTKGFAESVLLGDFIYSFFSTQKSESVSVVDESSILVAYSRLFGETEYAIDESLLEFGKNESETMTAADSGFLRMTDYADITYFAEDYVGSSQYF